MAWALSLALCTALTAGLTTPAHAAGPATGVLLVSGTVALPDFPCALPDPGQQACVGSFKSGANNSTTATVSGTIDGQHNGVPWTLVLNAPITSSFSYVDSLPPEPDCVEGLAAGQASFTTPLNNQGFGSYHNSVVPAAIVGASGTFDYQWRRMGTVLAFHVENLYLTLNVFGVGPVPVIEDANSDTEGDGVGEGGGVFLPTMSTMTIPHCVAPDDPDTANPIDARVTATLRVTTAP